MGDSISAWNDREDEKMTDHYADQRERHEKSDCDTEPYKTDRRDTLVVAVYMDDGRVFEYNVSSPDKGREHASKIVTTGYRHTPEYSDDLEWYPPHRIDKVKIEGGAESAYRDRVRAT